MDVPMPVRDVISWSPWWVVNTSGLVLSSSLLRITVVRRDYSHVTISERNCCRRLIGLFDKWEDNWECYDPFGFTGWQMIVTKQTHSSTVNKSVWRCYTNKSTALWRCLLLFILVNGEVKHVFRGRWQSCVVDINLLKHSSNRRFIFTIFCQVIWVFSKRQLDNTATCIFCPLSLFICHVASVHGISVFCCSERWHLLSLSHFSEIGPYPEASHRPTWVFIHRRLANRTVDYSPLSTFKSAYWMSFLFRDYPIVMDDSNNVTNVELKDGKNKINKQRLTCNELKIVVTSKGKLHAVEFTSYAALGLVNSCTFMVFQLPPKSPLTVQLEVGHNSCVSPWMGRPWVWMFNSMTPSAGTTVFTKSLQPFF